MGRSEREEENQEGGSPEKLERRGYQGGKGPQHCQRCRGIKKNLNSHLPFLDKLLEKAVNAHCLHCLFSHSPVPYNLVFKLIP